MREEGIEPSRGQAPTDFKSVSFTSLDILAKIYIIYSKLCSV